MIRNDFETGGFPLCDKSPVLCVADDFKIHAVYNRYDLITLLKTESNIRACYGVWPGKKSTDVFPLNPKAYVELPLPPEMHKDIDSAAWITVCTEFDGGFSKLSYCPKEATVTVESKDKALFDYIKKIGLRYTSVFE
jgi:hypothetical protein